MADAADLRTLALALAGTTEAPHFERTAFKRRTIYATLAGDRLSANLKLTPEEQALHCHLQPAALAPVANAWGQRGWTTVTLAALDRTALQALLTMAWAQAQPRRRR